MALEHTVHDPSLEIEEIGINAYLVSGVFPVLGPEVLALQRARCRAFGGTTNSLGF
jgi:hypothetical protein